MPELYPPISPYKEGDLKVSDLHTVHFECCGNPEGLPVVFLHGGPGGGISEDYRQYFDPKKWNVILFDQRGCGKSKPFAELKENTTWDLVSDIEKIREELGIEKWVVFGGSWGSTLSLAYGTSHPERCLGFILRGIFLLRDKEIQWFYQEGCSKIYPDAWEKYIAPIPEEERHDYVTSFYKRLTNEDPKVRLEAARAWSVWEASTSKLTPSEEQILSFGEDKFAEAFARIECHYFINKGFLKTPNYLIDNVEKIRHLPCHIVQGRYDVVCPAESAWELHRAWPESNLHIIQDAGHSLSESGIRSKIIEITDSFLQE